jgi:hypothetical protein
VAAFAAPGEEAGGGAGEAQAHVKLGRSAARRRLKFFIARILMILQALKSF